jgi:hypothetical protein
LKAYVVELFYEPMAERAGFLARLFFPPSSMPNKKNLFDAAWVDRAAALG